MSYHIISYHITPHHIMSYHIISHHITSHHITSHHITSHHIISRHIISRHITSYHIISYHIVSYHITSHHIIDGYMTGHTVDWYGSAPSNANKSSKASFNFISSVIALFNGAPLAVRTLTYIFPSIFSISFFTIFFSGKASVFISTFCWLLTAAVAVAFFFSLSAAAPTWRSIYIDINKIRTEEYINEES